MAYETFMFVLSRNYHFHDDILKSCFQRTKSNGKTLFLFFLISSAHPPSTTNLNLPPLPKPPPIVSFLAIHFPEKNQFQ